jgi:egghead protein (zeste-white 4 protein)
VRATVPTRERRFRFRRIKSPVVPFDGLASTHGPSGNRPDVSEDAYPPLSTKKAAGMSPLGCSAGGASGQVIATSRPPRLGDELSSDRLRRPPGHNPTAPGPLTHTAAPRFASFWAAYVLFLVVCWLLFDDANPDAFGWYVAIVWTLPIITSVRGVAGGMITSRRIRRAQVSPGPTWTSAAMLIVLVPTIGRRDTQPALERVVRSFCGILPAFFPRLRVDLIVEEGCEAMDGIASLADDEPRVRLIVVPRTYRTPNGTRFKARANEYANALRIAEGEATDSVWVLHMDDDTAVGVDTAQALVAFINAQQPDGKQQLHLAQGILTYPRELAANRLTWLADAVRPGCDISLFAISTGRGWPVAGLHGELLLVRASVEAAIGWDFGPRTTVEDAEFAVWFATRYPRQCDWFSGRSYGASPASVSDFIRQRERWFLGLLELAFSGSMPLRRRLLLLHNVVLWSLTPAAYPGLIFLVGSLLSLDTAPAWVGLLPLWAFNVGFAIWLYWEGLKINAASSAQPGRLWWEPVCLIALLPLFLLWEVLGIVRGLFRFFRHGDSAFAVIAKPH